VVGQSVVRHHPALVVLYAEGDDRMNPIEMEPGYSTREISGKCIKCLAEQKLGGCLRELLRGMGGNGEIEARYEALLSMLESPELRRLTDESERLLAEGEEVTVVLYLDGGEPRYEIKRRQITEQGYSQQ
jgi:hypothetical protein